MKITDTIGSVLKNKGRIENSRHRSRAVRLRSHRNDGAIRHRRAAGPLQQQAGRHLFRARLRPQGNPRGPPLPRHPRQPDHDQPGPLRHSAAHRRRVHDPDDPGPLPPSPRPRRRRGRRPGLHRRPRQMGHLRTGNKPFRSCRATSPAPIRLSTPSRADPHARAAAFQLLENRFAADCQAAAPRRTHQ